MVFKKWIEEKERKRLLHIHFLMDDNPSLSETVRERYRTMYSGVFYQRFILGRWVMAQGAIYRDAWNEDVLFGDDGLEWIYKNEHIMRRYIAIDYGTVNPMVYLDIYDDGTDIYVVRVLLGQPEGREREGQQSICRRPNGFIGGEHIFPTAVIIDPSAASFKIELRNRGCRAKETVETINADNNVVEGIRAVNTLLTRRRLHFHETNCPNCIKEHQSYVWDDKALAQSGREKPVKVADHAPDALRYFVSTIVKPRRVANA